MRADEQRRELGLLAPDSATGDRSAARRLWAAFSPRRPRPAEVATLNAALICLADHELAASTLAARVAASAWAHPYRVVLPDWGRSAAACTAAPRSR